MDLEGRWSKQYKKIKAELVEMVRMGYVHCDRASALSKLRWSMKMKKK